MTTTHWIERDTNSSKYWLHQTQFTHAQKDESSTITTMHLWNRRSNNRTHTANMSSIPKSQTTDGTSLHQKLYGKKEELERTVGFIQQAGFSSEREKEEDSFRKSVKTILFAQQCGLWLKTMYILLLFML